MNPLTLVKRIQNITAKEASLGISDNASWHAKYKDSAYVFVGGIPFDLTEGDLLAIFAQYGEIVDVNLVRDKGTGKSKGFAFVAYEDQRSTTLAVDNLNGAVVLGRTIRVDHVAKYKKKEEEDEETAQQKREERGVCRAFQRGECTRGDGCKFSHNEQRAAHTGWGEKDKGEKWGHDGYGVAKNDDRRPGNGSRLVREGDIDSRSKGQVVETLERELRQSNTRAEKRFGNHADEYGAKARGRDSRDDRSPRGHDRHGRPPKSRKHDEEVLPKSRGLEREEIRSTKHDRDRGEDADRREGKRSRRDEDRGHEQRSRDRRYDRGAIEPRSHDDDERSGYGRYKA